MDPDDADQDATEDVDMITAPPSDTMDTSTSDQPNQATTASSADIVNEQNTTNPMDVSQGMTVGNTSCVGVSLLTNHSTSATKIHRSPC